jgi:hydrogenase nickel incorporation protein HypA/HybF
MHELSVCQALIDQVAQVARRERAASVTAIHVSVGPLSGVEPQLLEQAYPLAAAGSLAEAAELCVESAPIRVYCDQCDRETTATASRLVCADCGNWRTTLVSGDELLLTHVELFREQVNV